MMKTIVLIITLMIGSNSFGQTDSKKLLASCCSETGRCTGSAYCRACKNCSGCKHCAKNGGSCGVCSTSNAPKPRQKSKVKTNSNIFSKRSINETLYVSVASLNLREGPGTKFRIIQKLNKDTKLIYLGKEKLWVKVKIEESLIVGYVYYKYLR